MARSESGMAKKIPKEYKLGQPILVKLSGDTRYFSLTCLMCWSALCLARALFIDALRA